jgi:hypothetical protein
MQANPDFAAKQNQPIRIDHTKAKAIGLDPVQKKGAQSKTATSVRITDNPYIDISKLPKHLQELYERNKSIYKKQVELYNKLKVADSDMVAKDHLEELKALDDERVANWSQIDAFTEAAKEPSPEMKLQQIQKAQRAELLGRYIRRTTRELETVKSAQKKAEKQAKIEEWQTELATLNVD